MDRRKMDQLSDGNLPSFKPPPKVESDVVRYVVHSRKPSSRRMTNFCFRIEPKTGSARPNISFEEWDGMLRIAL